MPGHVSSALLSVRCSHSFQIHSLLQHARKLCSPAQLPGSAHVDHTTLTPLQRCKCIALPVARQSQRNGSRRSKRKCCCSRCCSLQLAEDPVAMMTAAAPPLSKATHFSCNKTVIKPSFKFLVLPGLFLTLWLCHIRTAKTVQKPAEIS